MGIFDRILGRKDRPQSTFAYARINARVMPIDRGERYEDPLAEALSQQGLGSVTGAGTMQAVDGEIEYCGLDLELHDLQRAVPFVCDFLATRGAPSGSALEYQLRSKEVQVPFGFLEGLGIYLNGTDLPDEVYKQGDANQVYEDLGKLLAGRGEVQGHWRGPTETALYLYGHSAAEMRTLISKYLEETPICQRARIVQIT